MSPSPRLSSPAPPSMPALPHSLHGDDGARRSPMFMDDFQQLVSDAFSLKQPRLSLSVAPAPSPLTGARIAVTPEDRTIRSYFDHDTDDAPRRPSKASSRTSSLRPRSRSFGACNVQRATPVSSAHVGPRARTSVARRVIQTIRTRASALGLRPVVESAPPYVTAFPSAPPYLPIPTFSVPSSAATTRPNSTALPPADLPQYSFPPQAAQYVNPTTATSHQEIDLSEPRHRSSSIPVDFLQVPELPASHTATPGHSQCPSPAPRRASVQHVSAMPTRSRRPRTPSLPASPGQLHAHARLSPLPKSRSFNVLSLPGRSHSRGAPPVESVSPARLCSSSLGFEFGDCDRDSRCPSPFTNPRSPPPVPTSPAKSLTSRMTQGDEDMLEVPAYVFERRGSATSDISQCSGKSTRTLAERISKALPQISKLRSRSKLNLSVITNKSADSTPSSCNTSSAWSGSLPPTPNAPSFYGMSRRGSAFEGENGIISTDRVLTPESDPFKKASVEISLERENTPRPLESGELSPRDSRAMAGRNSKQQMAWKRSMGGTNGHSYTNSGDTITPLTNSATSLAPSPEGLDVVERTSFVFPLPTTSSTAYLEWSPISLRSTAALSAATDPCAHVVALTHSPASSKVSWDFVRLPPPGPPPTIPLPPSPASSGGSSPRLRRRKSWSSLRAAMSAPHGGTRGRPSGDRPPSPFPLKSAFSSVTSFADSASIASGRVSCASRFPGERSSEDATRSELPVRGSGGWVRGPRFAGGQGQGRGQSASSKGSVPSREPATSRIYSDLDQMVTQSMKQRPEPSRSRFTFPDQSSQIPARISLLCRPALRSSQSDSALRTRAQAQDGMNRGALPLPRPSDTVYNRSQWEAAINQSTTSFYSARSSMDSDASSVISFRPIEELVCLL